jgi:hypothetical protein
MNENPSIATKWNGRVLCSSDSKDTDKPVLKKEEIPKCGVRDHEIAMHR